MVPFSEDWRVINKFVSSSGVEEAKDCLYDLQKNSIRNVAFVCWLFANCSFSCCSREKEFFMRVYRRRLTAMTKMLLV